MSRVTSWIGPSITVNHPVTAAAPALATDGIGIASWDGFFSVASIIHIEKTAAKIVRVWILKSNDVWSMADDATLTETWNESDLISGICRAKRVYLQVDAIANVTRLDIEFLS